ncbi:integrin alpha-7 isoform X2 [Microcaecilia unicolor]|uniref:Integrin alpha-7 isoform X2 n=1 Tax=Microcaecilia unicolor TaxID=1415580 RepID=A0A6P7XAN9_9AMPH|nr:integrin alpha-7 isoform X2 [Microcaecilia unicolor]
MAGLWLQHFLLLLLLLPRSSAFNLDVTDTLLRDGDKGSLFGFSVALHRQLRPYPFSWILVGAPQALALADQGAIRTGGLFACPLNSENLDCYRLLIDSGVDDSKESKENQWLGVTVKSQGAGGKIVTCAHLYEARQRVHQFSETRDVIGRCYVLSEDLQISDELDGGEWKFCEGRPQGHERFGFCQQGMAAGFTSDSHYIMFGAPGTYNWKGILFVTNINKSDHDQLVYKTPEPTERVAGHAGDVAQNSYLGFSVDSGKAITRKHELSFVTGAPRANHTGAVVILKKDNVNRLVPEFTLWGENLASSFGYSVAVADLNSDDWMDLVVGAPNFFDRREEIGGAVYVYINQAGQWGSTKPLRLNGTYESMFGITVGCLDDINQDGFQDIAVGAPFDGAGKVYIYHGSSIGIIPKPAQILDGVGVGVKTFGYSISGGVDIDGNSYPDLLVGSLSDTVVLYRARPVVHVAYNISIHPHTIDLEHKNCLHSTGACVDLKACFSYTASPDSYTPKIFLEYVFDADVDRRKLGKLPRVSFLNRKPTDPDYQHSNVVELPRQKVRSCVKASFQLQENVRDKLHPIPVTLTYNIKHSRHRRQTDKETLAPLMPVLNAQVPNTYRAEVNFLREGCGDDKICQSNLQISYHFCYRVDKTDQFVRMAGGHDGHAIFALTGHDDIALEITITNLPSDLKHPERDGDDAHEAQLTASFPDTLFYSAYRPLADKEVECVSNPNGSQVVCELGNPMKRGAQVAFYLIISTSGITIETTELEVQLLLSTISEQPDLQPILAQAHVIIELPLSVSGKVTPHQVFYSGTVLGESAMKTEENIGSLVEYEVAVSNKGQSLKTLGSAFLNLMWPLETSNGKWLLYPLKIHLQEKQRSGLDTRCSPSQAIDPLRLAADSHRRLKRDAEVSSAGSRRLVAFAARKKEVALDCARGTAKCLVFQCPLYTFDSQAVLKIRARLWNSTFLEDYPPFSSVELIVRANITVKSTIKNLVLNDATTEIPLVIYSDPDAAEYGGIPWWIILIAVLAGMLMLALLVLLLWKCGFFKRTRYHENKVPQYHAVKIPREDRQLYKEEKTGTIQRKEWVTNWNENDGYSHNAS